MELLVGMMRVLEPSNILFVFLGTFVGVSFGAVPGLDPTTGTALLIPLTYALTPTQALLFLTCLYIGGVFGGSITAILFRVPGSSEAVMTSLDGYELTKKGLAGKALGVAITSSALGGLFSVFVMILLAPQLAKVALQFGPAEYFALGILGLCCVVSAGSKDPVKGMVSMFLGLLLATVGIDAITGTARFTFGSSALLGGVAFVPVIIGLFAAAEVFTKVSERSQGIAVEAGVSHKNLSTQFPSLRELAELKWTILRSAAIGTWVGILPGVGATTAAIMGYTQEVRLSREPKRFGTGVIQGVAAPEAANNAGAVGAFVPLLGLGIPGSATTAILIGAFLIHGLKVGPLLFMQNRDIVYSLFGGMFLTNATVVLAGFLAVRLFVRFVYLPYPILSTSIMTFCVIGSLALGDVNGVLMMFVSAIAGFFMAKYEYPAAPVILGMVLGPIVEASLRRALMISGNSVGEILFRPIAGGLLLIALVLLVLPLVSWLRRRPGRSCLPS